MKKSEAFRCLNLVVFSTFEVCPCHFKTNKLIRVILPLQKHYGTDLFIVSVSLE